MSLRTILSVLALLLLGGFAAKSIADLVSDTSKFPPHDFVEYWAAGHLNLHGQNPYSPELMYPLQRDHIGWDPVGQAIMMWNPPWTLTLAMPLGAMPWRTAQLVWLVLRLACLGWSAYLLMRLYPGRPAVPWVVTFTWLPCYIALQYGQIPPLMLLGLCWYMECDRRGWSFLAGAACVLVAVKPHLFYLLWLGIAVRAVVHRDWRVILGGVSGGFVLTVWPVVMNPTVLSEYLAAVRANPPSQWQSPTIGTFLRLIFGEEKFWLQSLPMLPAILWFVWQTVRDLRTGAGVGPAVPWLVFVSVAFAPYGAWPYDLTVLVLPFVMLAHRCSGRQLVVGFILVNLGMLVSTMFEVPAKWFVWVAPTALLGAVVRCRSESRS